MALLLAITCNTAFTHMQLRFRAGVLHSGNDEPAAVFAPGSYAPMKNAYLSSIRDFGPEGRAANLAMFLTRRQTKCSQMCWYRAGELHRDHGPAVDGSTYLHVSGQPVERRYDVHVSGQPVACYWWYMYYHGRLMASDENSFTGAPTELTPLIRSRCDCGRDCVRLVACDVITSARKIDSRGVLPFALNNVSYDLSPMREADRGFELMFGPIVPDMLCYAFVYRSCTGVYLECPYPGTLVDPLAEENRAGCRYYLVGDPHLFYSEGRHISQQ